jgi:hypothetical protein
MEVDNRHEERNTVDLKDEIISFAVQEELRRKPAPQK